MRERDKMVEANDTKKRTLAALQANKCVIPPIFWHYPLLYVTDISIITSLATNYYHPLVTISVL